MNQGRKPPLLSDVLPKLADELKRLLDSEDSDLAAQVPSLRIVDRCRCGDDFCATFYTKARPRGEYGPDIEILDLAVERGMLILDVVDRQIMSVEVLSRHEVRRVLDEILPP